jgi:protein-tyrosine-phosphatase
MTDQRARRFAALGDVSRLAIVEALLDGDASPSELSAALQMPGNLLAHHVDTLIAAGLVRRRRSSGDGRRTYLSLDRAHLPRIGGAPRLPRPSRVVFVCTRNAARSVLAEALWAQRSPIPVTSAGTDPAHQIDPGTRSVADAHGVPLPGHRPRHVHDVVTPDDLVVSVCDQVFERLDQVPSVHWSIPDPGAGEVSYQDVFGDIARRVAVFADQWEEFDE